MSLTVPSADARTVATCDSCGNAYDRAFTVTQGDRTGVFDSFECAIRVMAPQCAHCGCRVIGHGIDSGGLTYCCPHCARQRRG